MQEGNGVRKHRHGRRERSQFLGFLTRFLPDRTCAIVSNDSNAAASNKTHSEYLILRWPT